MTDNSIMKFGKYKGTAMVNIPASYLIWLAENYKLSGDVKQYIEANRTVLQSQVNDENQRKQNRQ